MDAMQIMAAEGKLGADARMLSMVIIGLYFLWLTVYAFLLKRRRRIAVKLFQFSWVHNLLAVMGHAMVFVLVGLSAPLYILLRADSVGVPASTINTCFSDIGNPFFATMWVHTIIAALALAFLVLCSVVCLAARSDRKRHGVPD